jgi:hypothetical protein
LERFSDLTSIDTIELKGEVTKSCWKSSLSGVIATWIGNGPDKGFPMAAFASKKGIQASKARAILRGPNLNHVAKLAYVNVSISSEILYKYQN